MHLYLAGPIDFAEDAGKGWRQEITPKLLCIPALMYLKLHLILL